MSFYRIYRPKILEELDNTTVRSQLLQFLSKDRKDLPHAYLFSGPRGSGKTTAARLVAKLFNCTKISKTKGPCGECDQCKSIGSGINMDVIEIDAASNRGIDEIRSLRERIGLTPSNAQYTVYIIDEVHMLTAEAFNALLKTLEEPPAHAVFILATTDPHKVPITIISRCVHISFGRGDTVELKRALSRIIKEEKLSIDEDAIATIVEYADGSFRDAVKYLEQVSFEKGNISNAAVRSLLTLGESTITDRLLSTLAEKNSHEALDLIREALQNGMDMRFFLIDILKKVELLLLTSAQGRSVDKWTDSDIRLLISYLSRAYSELRVSPIPQLPIELAVIEFCTKQPNSPWPSSYIKNSAKNGVSENNKDTVNKNKTDPADNTAHNEPCGLLTLERITECWKDIIEELKRANHSIAGVLRSTRPKSVTDDIVTIEAFYKFHQEKLSEPKVKEILVSTFKKLFGEKVKIEIVLGKK